MSSLEIAVAIALASQTFACYSLRVGAGMTTDADGQAGLQVSATVAFASDHAGIGAQVAYGTTGAAVTTNRLLTYHRALTGDDHEAESMWRFDAGAGQRAIVDGDVDNAYAFGVGAAYLRVLGENTSCVYFGLGDAIRRALGVEAWIQGHAGGDRSLTRGMAMLGVTYQIDWTLRGSDCGS